MGNEEIIIYQVQNIDFIFSNYLNFPKAERTYFYIELLGNLIKINELFKKYKNYLYGFSIQSKDLENKKITGEVKHKYVFFIWNIEYYFFLIYHNQCLILILIKNKYI